MPKQDTINDHRIHESDTGSPEVQIALLTQRIRPDVSVDAVAARDPQRAAAYARKHGIAKVHGL